MIDHIFDMMKTWDHFGQAIFVLLVLLICIAFIGGCGSFILVLFRGYPPKSKDTEKEEDNASE